MGLAPRLGKTHQALSAEVRGAQGFKLGLLDAMSIQMLTGDKAILYAMAAELGEMCIPLPQNLIPDASPCAARVSLMAQDFAALMGELAADLADGVISDNELARIEERCGELIAAVQGMLKHVAAMNAATHRGDGQRPAGGAL